MSKQIQHKRGLQDDLPTLTTAEFGYTTDTERLFIGTNQKNIRLLDEKDLLDLDSIYERQDEAEKSKAVGGNGDVKFTLSQSTDDILDYVLKLNTQMFTGSIDGKVKNAPTSSSGKVIGHKTDATNAWITYYAQNGKVFTNYLLNGSWTGWKDLISKKITTLWSGDTRGDFTSTFNLVDSILNYDFIYIIATPLTGVNSYERLIHVESMANDNINFTNSNISDTEGSYNWQIREYSIYFTTSSKNSFKVARSIALNVNGVTSVQRIEKAEDIGISRIIGVKFS